MSTERLRDSIDYCLKDGVTNNSIKDVITSFKDAFNIPLEDSRLAHFKYAIERIDIEFNGKIRPIVYHNFYKKDGMGDDDAFVQFTRGGYFLYINKDLESERKRFLIGHELAHILIAITKDQVYNTTANTDRKREIVASILSYVMIRLQGRFYKDQTIPYYYEDDTDATNKLFDMLLEAVK